MLTAASSMQAANTILSAAQGLRKGNKYRECDVDYLTLLRNALTQEFPLYETVAEIPHALPYEAGCKYIVNPIHHGQNKLMLSEIQFFTKMAIDEGFIIYVGSAPGDHIPLLASLYPKFRFVLIDPGHKDKTIEKKFSGVMDKLIVIRGGDYSEQIIRGNKQISIIPDFCTDEMMDNLSKLPEVVGMISDIRTSRLCGTDVQTTGPEELDVIGNQMMQANWFKILRVAQENRGDRGAGILFKFRIPFVNVETTNAEMFINYLNDACARSNTLFGINWVDRYNSNNFDEFPYIKATFFLQAFAPNKSAEIRGYVAPGEPLEIKNYNIRVDFEEKLNYHLSIGRQFAFLKNRNSYDLALAMKILNDAGHMHLSQKIILDSLVKGAGGWYVSYMWQKRTPLLEAPIVQKMIDGYKQTLSKRT
jgi:hypothetical protein